MQKNAFKKPFKKKFAPKGKTVYIGNLRYNIDEKALYGLFGKFGKVKNVKLITKPGTEESKGIAFVDMLKGTDAEKAIKNLDGRIIGGRTVKVSEAIDNMKKPAPKKESKDAQKIEKLMKEMEIVERKKAKRKRGLNELFTNTGRA